MLLIYSQSNNKEINLQIIQTLSMFVINITNKNFLYYLMSNNFINNFISNTKIMRFDDEYFSYYINFLKSLALKLDSTTLQFFFRADISSFPLLENALKLYNHPDNMIQSVVKNIFLIILKLRYQPLIDYLCNLPCIIYFSFISCQMKDNLIALSKETNYDKFKTILDDIGDDLLFIQDVYALLIEKINYILNNCLFYYCIIPYVLYPLDNLKKEKINKKDGWVKKSICLHFTNILLTYIKDETFLNILITLILFPKRTNKIHSYINNKPLQPENYYYNWNQSVKRTSTSFLNYVKYNFNMQFMKSFIFNNNSKYVQVQKIYSKYQKKIVNNLDINNENTLKEITQDILNQISSSEISIMASFHTNLSIGTGINLGLSTKSSSSCVVNKIDKLFQKYYDESLNKKYKLINNDIKNNIFYIISDNEKCNKREKYILLINIFLRNILIKNKDKISKLLLKESKIIPGNVLDNSEISLILKEKKTILIDDDNAKDSIISNTKDSTFKMIPLKSNDNYNFNNEEFKIEYRDSSNNDNIHSDSNINGKILKHENLNDKKNKKNIISINDLIKNNKIYKEGDTNKKTNCLINIDLNSDVDEEEHENLISDDENYGSNSNQEFIIQRSTENDSLTKKEFYEFNSVYFDNLKNRLSINFQFNNNKNKYFYDEELVTLLIDQLEIDNKLSSITVKCIIDNILSLISSPKIGFIYDNCFNCFLDSKNKNKIKLIYSDYKKEMLNNYGNKKNYNKSYKLFIKQYDEFIKINNFDYDIITKGGDIALTNKIIKKENALEVFYKIGDNKIIIFMLIHDLNFKISNDIFILQDKGLFINNFPLKRNELVIGQKYKLFDLDGNVKYFDCKCKIIKNKNSKINNEFFNANLLLYENFLYIGDSTTEANNTTIINKYLISFCTVTSDDFNNKNIIVLVFYDDNKENNIEINLDFKDYETSKKIKDIIKIEIKKAKKYEIYMFNQFMKGLK